MTPKFRAWHNELGRMMLVNTMFFFANELEELELNDSIMNDNIPVYPDEIKLMQSTCLFDRNGKEIFEGDIVSVGTATRVVKKNNLLGFYIEEGEKIGYFSDVVDVNCLDLFVKDFGEEAEILGNIYENKELLDA